MNKLFTHIDLDGVGCAILAQLYDSTMLIEYCDYNSINRKVGEFLTNKVTFNHVFITDISVSETVAERINNRVGNFVLLDHHPTALNLNKYEWCCIKIEDTATGIQTCGTELFYQYLVSNGYLERSKALDMFVEKVRDYDTWRWSTLGSEGKISKQLNDLLKIYGRDTFVKWCVKYLKVGEFPQFEETERSLLQDRQNEIDKYIEKKHGELFTGRLCGKVCGFVFANQYVSELGNRLCQLHPEIDFVAMIDMESCTVSYRSIKEDIDLGQDVAKFFGGGGHPKAAGSSFSKNIWPSVVKSIFSS